MLRRRTGGLRSTITREIDNGIIMITAEEEEEGEEEEDSQQETMPN
jgi:hypothetical protein